MFGANYSSLGQVSFNANASKTTVEETERFTVDFNIKNTNHKRFNPPNFKNFQVLGRSTGSSMVYSNGQTQRTQTITYTLLPRTVGTFTIPKAEITTQNNEVLYSKPITVKVVKSGSSASSKAKSNELKDKVFLRTVVSNSQPVVGEQVTIDYRIYTQVSIEQYQITKEPDFSRFYVHYIKEFDANRKTETLNGKRYSYVTLRRVALFPNQQGEMTIDPMIMDVGVPVNGRRSMFNPFYQIQAYTIKSDRIKLNVQPTPDPPNDHSGIVGRYNMQINYSNPDITSDDVIQLKIKISGKGDIKQVTAPEIGADKQFFDFLEPQVNEKKYEKSGQLYGRRDFTYVISPKATGDFVIKPSLVFYDPLKKKYVRKDSTLRIQVSQGEATLPEKEDLNNKRVLDEMEQVAHTHSINSLGEPIEAQHLRLYTPWFGGFGFFAALFICLTPIPLFVVLRKRKDKLDNMPSAEKIRKAAKETAFNKLNELAEESRSPLDTEAACISILKTFVSQKFIQPVSSLDKDTIQGILKSNDVSEALCDRVISLIRSSEVSLFSGGLVAGNDPQRQTFIETTRQIIDEI